MNPKLFSQPRPTPSASPLDQVQWETKYTVKQGLLTQLNFWKKRFFAAFYLKVLASHKRGGSRAAPILFFLYKNLKEMSNIL